jgi:hypothetical protein
MFNLALDGRSIVTAIIVVTTDAASSRSKGIEALPVVDISIVGVELELS